MQKWGVGWLALLLFLIGSSCASPSPPSNTPQADSLLLPTSISVPPTFTPASAIPFPTLPPIETSLPQPSPIPNTPIPFDDVVISVRLTIPALGYDRLLEGTIGSDIQVRDETADTLFQIERQAGILIELQQALEDFELAPLPDDCSDCPILEVMLPLDDVAYSGWLQDPVLLASLQNYFAVTLGAHFPPQTAVGLRRSASPFAPAQSFALLGNGSIFIWQENQERPVRMFTAEPELITAVSFIADSDFESQYAVSCEGMPVETLQLQLNQAEPQIIGISCPAYALPTDLMPLYAQIDRLMALNVEDALPMPNTGFPLTAVLQYQIENDIQLTIYSNGNVSLIQTNGQPANQTITIEAYDSLALPFFENNIVQLGLRTFNSSNQNPVTLLIRGPEGVYDASWPQSDNIPALENLNALVETMRSGAVSPTTTPTDLTSTPIPPNAPTPTATP